MRKLTYKILYQEYVSIKKDLWEYIYSYYSFIRWFKRNNNMCLSISLEMWKKHIVDKNEYHREYYKKNKEKLQEYHKEYQIKYRQRLVEKSISIKRKCEYYKRYMNEKIPT